MNAQSLRWDDLRLVLAIRKAGSLSGAGRVLSVSHATVFRRLQSLEERLGVRLFERSATGYVPTPAGEELSTTAERIEEEVHRAERRIMGQDLRPDGTVRVTTTDTLLAGLLSSVFASFRQAYPTIDLEVAVSHQLFNLSKREADVAIRPMAGPHDTLVGERLGEISQAIYVSKRHPASSGDNRDLTQFEWVGPDSHLSKLLDQWMRRSGLDDCIHYRVSTLLGIRDAVRAGVGCSALPCYLCDPDPQLVRIGDPIPDLAVDLWLLTHPDMENVARIKVFLEFVADAIARHRPRLTGEHPLIALD